MTEEQFPGTVASVRRALERAFVEEDPRDAAWRGRVGNARMSVRVDVAPDPADAAQAMVVASSEVLPVPKFTGDRKSVV